MRTPLWKTQHAEAVKTWHHKHTELLRIILNAEHSDDNVNASATC